MAPSAFLRTGCCDAPVVQQLESLATLTTPVRCIVCGAEAGAPGLEDVPESERELLEFDLARRQLAEMATARG